MNADGIEAITSERLMERFCMPPTHAWGTGPNTGSGAYTNIGSFGTAGGPVGTSHYPMSTVCR
jgi:hypothetical protein